MTGVQWLLYALLGAGIGVAVPVIGALVEPHAEAYGRRLGDRLYRWARR